jgi:hypothetical protein
VRRLIALLNTLPTLKSALVMGGMVFAASVAGGLLSSYMAKRAAPQVKLHCVCEP